MSKVLSFIDSNRISHRLVLEDGDLVLLKELKNKQKASFQVTISGAGVDGNTAFITHKGRIYDLPKNQLPG
ncbi:hypothetical protein [Paucibacter sp. B51]|uniref:hypothetical protein n=1 Tax=Paucibacter sp. B51 TaxID=2993315 RepID=UPI0022EBDB2B|nr:hypothetical protein [Paucibacter sp. B51]